MSFFSKLAFWKKQPQDIELGTEVIDRQSSASMTRLIGYSLLFLFILFYAIGIVATVPAPKALALR